MKLLKILVSILITSALFATCSKEEITPHASIAFLIGDVKVNSVPAQIEDVIKKDDLITTGENSFCDIKIGQSVMRIKANSSIRMSQLKKNNDIENTQIDLATGKILCKPKKLLKDEKFIIKTPTAVAGVRGTQFSVETDKLNTTRIKVFTGEVKVAKRVKYFDSAIDKVIEVATPISKEEKVIITQKQVKEAEIAVEDKLKKAPSTALAEESFIASAIQKSTKEIAIDVKDIEKFKPEDFSKENKEIIEVEEKPKEDIKIIRKTLKEDLKEPRPEGRIVITRYDIYFVKDGKIIWEGKIINEPLRKDGKIFLSTGDYVICSDENGTVIWKTKIKNDGISFKGELISVKQGYRSLRIRSSNGKRF